MEEDRLSYLPDSLIFEVLLKLPTKDVVKTSVLSKRWTKVWRNVHGLDLKFRDVMVIGESFPDFTTFVVFVEKFLAFNRRLCLRNFKLEFHCGAHSYYLTPWISTAVKRNVQHLHVLNGSSREYKYDDEVKVPPSVYTCDSLVSLKLFDVTLPSPRFVSLPSLKDIYLERVRFANDSNDLSKIDMMRSFFVGIRSVQDMVICFETLEVMYGYSSFEPLPLLCGLSSLRVKHPNYNKWDMLLVVFSSCPNLKSLVLERCSVDRVEKPISLLYVPQCLKSSLKYLEIRTPWLPEAKEMNLLGCFLENSAVLKKVTLHLYNFRKRREYVTLKKLYEISKLSTSCQVELLYCDDSLPIMQSTRNG